HKLRRAMVNAAREPLHGDFEIDDTWIGGPQAGITGSRQLKDRRAGSVFVGGGRAGPPLRRSDSPPAGSPRVACTGERTTPALAAMPQLGITDGRLAAPSRRRAGSGGGPWSDRARDPASTRPATR